APGFAEPHGGHGPCHGPRARGPAEERGGRARPHVAGDGQRLQRPQSAARLDAAGRRGAGGAGAGGAPDGAAASGQYRLLVWPAGLDGAGLHAHQTGRLAVAAHPYAPAGPGGPPGAGRRGGALGGGVRVGGAGEETSPASTVRAGTALGPRPARPRRATRLRLVSVLRRGWPLRLVAWRDQAPLPLGRFVPAPWPAVPVPEAVPPSLPALALPQAA